MVVKMNSHLSSCKMQDIHMNCCTNGSNQKNNFRKLQIPHDPEKSCSKNASFNLQAMNQPYHPALALYLKSRIPMIRAYLTSTGRKTFWWSTQQPMNLI